MCVLLFDGYHYCYFVVPVFFFCGNDYLNAKKKNNLMKMQEKK